LLQRPRGFLLKLPLPALLVAESRDPLQKFLQAAFAGDAGQGHEVELGAKEPVLKTFRLIARSPGNSSGALFTALFDVTAERRLLRERQAVLAREQARAEQLATEVAERMHAEEEVKALLQRLVTVQEQERHAIARNLHDHLGQQLTALRLTLTALRSAKFSRDGLNGRLDKIDEIVSRIDRDVDHLAWDLRPAVLDGAGLPAALAEFLHQWSAATGIQADLHETGPTKVRLLHDVELHLYRIVQEALNNIVKHAAAKHVNVLLERRGDDFTVIVEDDGRGFDTEAASPPPSDRRGGMGLISMRERAALIGGSLQVETAVGKGTTIFVRLSSAPPPSLRFS
jgi:signal transduction histidine kinase